MQEKQPRKEILKMCIEWKKRKEFALEIFFALELSQKNLIFVGERTYSIYHESKEGWIPFTMSQGY